MSTLKTLTFLLATLTVLVQSANAYSINGSCPRRHLTACSAVTIEPPPESGSPNRTAGGGRF